MLVKTDFAVGFTTHCTGKAGYFKLYVSVFSAERVIHKHFVSRGEHLAGVSTASLLHQKSYSSFEFFLIHFVVGNVKK